MTPNQKRLRACVCKFLDFGWQFQFDGYAVDRNTGRNLENTTTYQNPNSWVLDSWEQEIKDHEELEARLKTQEQIKQNAWEKLTPDEREAFGMKRQ